MKTSINSIVFGLAIVLAAIFLGNAYKDRTKSQGNIQVTGLGKSNFTSDLIVWEGSYEISDFNLKHGFELLKKDKEKIKTYLKTKGVPAEKIVFSAVNSNQVTKSTYSTSGKYIGEEFIGYRLSQSIQIESNQVEKVELVSREITELLNDGIQFYSEPPRYYFTKLADLKIEMISRATEDARIRAEKIAEFSGGKLGELSSAKMGVFQITGQNSKEEYSWGGTFNTSSKEKTASITMKLDYNVN